MVLSGQILYSSNIVDAQVLSWTVSSRGSGESNRSGSGGGKRFGVGKRKLNLDAGGHAIPFSAQPGIALDLTVLSLTLILFSSLLLFPHDRINDAQARSYTHHHIALCVPGCGIPGEAPEVQ